MNFFTRADGRTINLNAVVAIDYDDEGAKLQMCNGRIFGIVSADVDRLKEALEPAKAEVAVEPATMEVTLDDPTRRLMEDLGWIRK